MVRWRPCSRVQDDLSPVRRCLVCCQQHICPPSHSHRHKTSALVSDTIFRSFYVDDVLRSCKSVADATEVIHGTKDVLNHGGFKLTKFAANDREILKLIDDDDLAKEVKELVPNTVSKALGIKWDVFQDSFYYVSKGISDDGEVTRRKILSYVSSLYEPLGLVCPVVICGKLIFSGGHPPAAVLGQRRSIPFEWQVVVMGLYSLWSRQSQVWQMCITGRVWGCCCGAPSFWRCIQYSIWCLLLFEGDQSGRKDSCGSPSCERSGGTFETYYRPTFGVDGGCLGSEDGYHVEAGSWHFYRALMLLDWQPDRAGVSQQCVSSVQGICSQQGCIHRWSQ